MQHIRQKSEYAVNERLNLLNKQEKLIIDIPATYKYEIDNINLNQQIDILSDTNIDY